ncbi:hypothetical protein ScPMuIL_014497 [Solemya velum]
MRGAAFLLISVFGICFGAQKKWTRDTNFENSQNWEGGRAPCGNDVVIIPENSPTVFIQTNTSIKELVLPRNGEVVLGSVSSVAFTGTRNLAANCPDSGKNIKFTAVGAPSWLDPINWCETGDNQDGCRQVPLLDSQKIPGIYDDAYFPDGHFFSADLGSNLNITVKTMKIWDQTYTTNTFGDFRKTTEGKKMFPKAKNAQSGVVKIQNQPCSDVTGCATGNDKKQIMDEICKFEKPRCARSRCDSPVQPAGHCCRICGAVLVLTYGSTFNLETLINGVKTNVMGKRTNFSEVSLIPGKLSSGKIQLVLTNDDGEISREAADMIEAHIQSDIDQQGTMYSVTTMSSMQSGNPRAPSADRHTGSDSMTGGDIVGIIFGIGAAALVIVILIVILVYRRRGSGTGGFKFQLFRQFPSLRRRLQSHMDSQDDNDFSSQVVETIGSGNQAFSNPTFGYSGYLNDRVFEMSPGTNVEESAESGSFSNPLYDTQIASVFHDPTKVVDEEAENKDVEETNGI